MDEVRGQEIIPFQFLRRRLVLSLPGDTVFPAGESYGSGIIPLGFPCRKLIPDPEPVPDLEFAPNPEPARR